MDDVDESSASELEFENTGRGKNVPRDEVRASRRLIIVPLEVSREMLCI